MATALVVPVAGPYTGTYDALPLGTLSDDGYELSVTFAGQEINETDAYGLTLVEAIFRGMNWRARMRGLEWKTGLLAALQQFGTGGGSGLNPAMATGSIGSKWSLTCLPLILTSILGSPLTPPATLTATLAGMAPGSQSLFNLTSKVRELPLEMVLLPYAASGALAIPFSTT
jgi:hypothetical protein